MPRPASGAPTCGRRAPRRSSDGSRRSKPPAAGSAGRTAIPATGPTYIFTDPDGHELGLYYESERYSPRPSSRPRSRTRPRPVPARGASVRRLDHINYLGVDVKANSDFLRDTLGGMVTEQIVLDDGTIAGSWLTFTNKTYDAVYTRDRTGTPGRLHHIAFATDTREDILRAADIALEQGVFIETGPHKHAIQQTFFLYVYEPGGNPSSWPTPGPGDPRARLATGQLDRGRPGQGQAWGLKTIESFHTHGTPPVEHAR